MKLICIKAVDWTKYTGTWDKDFPFLLNSAYITGILLDENDEVITIAQVYFSSGEVRDVLVIPKSNVLEIHHFEIVS